MTNWEEYFGTPEVTAVTLMDFLFHSRQSKLEDPEGIALPFDVTAESTIPSLTISRINPGTSLLNWLNSEVDE